MLAMRDARIAEIDAAVADAGTQLFGVVIRAVDERAVATRTPSRGMGRRSGSAAAVVADPLAKLVFEWVRRRRGSGRGCPGGRRGPRP